MLRDLFYNIGSWVYIILVVGSLFVYGFHFNDSKYDSKSCAAYYDDVFNQQKDILYWMDNDLCCHYALQNNMIIQECQMN